MFVGEWEGGAEGLPFLCLPGTMEIVCVFCRRDLLNMEHACMRVGVVWFRLGGGNVIGGPQGQ